MFRLLQVRPLTSARRSALTYVPALLFTRVLSLARLFLVTSLLGGPHTPEFGRYNLSLSLVNWCVPILLLGLGDVAERYAAAFARHGRLPLLITRHARRLASIAFPAAALLILLSFPFGQSLLHDPALARSTATVILILVAANALVLVWYQYTAMLLRGLRAYAASATMETLAALLLVAFSTLAAIAPAQNAAFLLLAYLLSNLLPATLFAFSLRRFIRITPDLPTSPPPTHPPHSFANFALLRLLLTMSFSLLAVWSVQYLAPQPATLASSHFAMPFNIAYFLGSAGVTLWSSAYAIAAAAWAAHDHPRARRILLQIGGLGGLSLIGSGLLILAAKPLLLAALNPEYHPAINSLLNPALAMFTLYALLAWASLFGDLHERSWIGALLWAIAVATQLSLLLAVHFGLFSLTPESASLTASTAGLVLALLVGFFFLLHLLRSTENPPPQC